MPLPLQVATGRALISASARASGTLLLSDTFTGVDGTSLDAHAMDQGSGWTEDVGDWVITGNKAQLVTATAGVSNYATANAGQAAVDVRVSVTFDAVDAGARAGLCVRQSGTSLWEIYLAESTDEVELWENNAGTRALKQKTAHVFANGATLGLKVVAVGTDISIYVDEVLKFTANDCTLNQTATRCGVWAWGVDTAAHRWEDFTARVP